MNANLRLMQRRFKQCVAGLLFVGLLIGASGTVFTAFAVAIGHLGTGPTAVPIVRVVTSQASVNGTSTESNRVVPPTAPSGLNAVQGYQAPVMEYSNTQPAAANGATAFTGGSSSSDGVNSQLADAMQQAGVYIGQSVQNTFGSMLKGVLNALFINTN